MLTADVAVRPAAAYVAEVTDAEDSAVAPTVAWLLAHVAAA